MAVKEEKKILGIDGKNTVCLWENTVSVSFCY